MAKKRSRMILTLGAAAVIGAALIFSFWPRPMMVDMGAVTRGRMTVTIDEEGRTRVHDAYVVATPVAGRLLRVHVEPGDPVIGNESVIAEMLPTNPSALDARSRAEALADVAAAEAALRQAHAERNRAIADKELADVDLRRTRRLREASTISQEALDRAIREARAGVAALHTAEATIAVRQAELANARARLISFGAQGLAGDGRAGSAAPFAIHAPITGCVLRVMQESETTLPAGTPIIEIGDIDNDLEVVVELLSTDAVQVSPGDRVIFEDWGGSKPLNGVVDRVDPWGFTKFSALGVEEQRVNTIIRFADPPRGARRTLGHGYRVEARIIVWEDDKALIVLSSALFRNGQDWAVFVVEDGTATLRRVEIGRNNGIEAQVLDGLEPGERVILYPPSELIDGTAVAQREIE